LVKNNYHTITLNEVLESSVNITISSEPINFLLGVNENKEIDLDNDGVNDLNVSLVSISNNNAEIFVKEIKSLLSTKLFHYLDDSNGTWEMGK
jgi:hypothetical protein